MTTDAPASAPILGEQPSPRNALELLVEHPDDATATIETALEASGSLDHVEPTPDGDSPDAIHVRAAKHMRKQIAEHVKGILSQIPIGDMLVGGWKHLSIVNKAKIETAKDGTTRTVSAGHHELTVRHDPRIDLVVDHVPVPLLKLFLDAVFTIGPSVFTITAGEITTTTPGPISAKAVLSSNKATILERSTPQIDPRGLWQRDFDGPFIVTPDPPAAPEIPEMTKSQLPM